MLATLFAKWSRSMRTDIDDRPVKVICDEYPPAIAVDQRLVKLAIKQLLDNALKYSPPRRPSSSTFTMAVA